MLFASLEQRAARAGREALARRRADLAGTGPSIMPSLVVGILQVELAIDWADSLKDKRSVISSVKSRVQREFLASAAEIGDQDLHRTAVLGVVVASSDLKQCQSKLDRIVQWMEKQKDCYVCDHRVEILTGR